MDITGNRMEGLQVGDMHGAFEIVQSLDEADAAATAALRLAAGGIALGLTVCGALSLVVLASIRSDESSKASRIGTEVAEEISDNTASVASAVEELSVNVRNISQSTSLASQTAQDVVRRVAATHAYSSALDRSSHEIGTIVQMIESIAEQTNLLALNATIEAARAGDAGKGFAVVAGEVKGLAQQTAEATGTITSKIASIQNTSQDLLGELREMESVVHTINESQNEIASAISQQQAAAESISCTIHSVLDSSRSLCHRLSRRSD
ncbi:MAG: hypothetical protein KDA96_04765 [Planctomycetaceae bacterium]|nr:hypothetical protein [Planctomycetaceae bacterium]